MPLTLTRRTLYENFMQWWGIALHFARQPSNWRQTGLSCGKESAPWRLGASLVGNGSNDSANLRIIGTVNREQRARSAR